MKPQGVLAVLAVLTLGACAPKGPPGVDARVLAEEVGMVVGDPGRTCVVLSEAGSGKVLWRSAKSYVCARTLPACTSAELISVETLARRAASGATVQTGCSNVSWAAGPTRRKGVVYAAVMQGERAFPGMEIARRLEGAFERAGL